MNFAYSHTTASVQLIKGIRGPSFPPCPRFLAVEKRISSFCYTPEGACLLCAHYVLIIWRFPTSFLLYKWFTNYHSAKNGMLSPHPHHQSSYTKEWNLVTGRRFQYFHVLFLEVSDLSKYSLCIGSNYIMRWTPILEQVWQWEEHSCFPNRSADTQSPLVSRNIRDGVSEPFHMFLWMVALRRCMSSGTLASAMINHCPAKGHTCVLKTCYEMKSHLFPILARSLSVRPLRPSAFCACSPIVQRSPFCHVWGPDLYPLPKKFNQLQLLYWKM